MPNNSHHRRGSSRERSPRSGGQKRRRRSQSPIRSRSYKRMHRDSRSSRTRSRSRSRSRDRRRDLDRDRSYRGDRRERSRNCRGDRRGPPGYGGPPPDIRGRGRFDPHVSGLDFDNFPRQSNRPSVYGGPPSDFRGRFDPPSNHRQLHTRWQNHKNYDRLPFDSCRNVEDVLQLAMEHKNNLPANQTAAMWTFIVRLISNQECQQNRMEELEQVIRSVLQLTMNSFIRCNSKELSTITLSSAKIVRSIRDAKQRRRANIYHQAFDKVLQESNSNPNNGILHALAKATNANIRHFDARCLSNTAYAYALWGYDPTIDGQSLLAAIAEKSIDCIHLFKPQERLFSPQNLSNVIWAYATLNIHHPALFKKLGDAIAAMDDLKSFKPQDYSNTVWAYATANIQHPALFKKVGDEIARMDDLNSFKPQELANTVWAYATANGQHIELFKKVANEIVAMDNLKSFYPQALANIIWAYATANVQHSALFKKVGDEIARMDDLNSFKPQELANTVWAYATAGVQYPALFKKFGDEVVATDDWESFKSQNLSNIAWAYTVSNIDSAPLFNSAFRQELLNRQNEFIGENLSQLYQWHLWQTKEQSNDGLPDSLRDKCKQIFLSADTTSSALQKEVVSELISIGLDPVEEYLTESGYSIDALVEINGEKVGVEVDGPSHFIGRRPNGRTLLKRRQVESIDRISLLSVPYWEWDKLGKDRDKKQKYVLSLLKLTT